MPLKDKAATTKEQELPSTGPLQQQCKNCCGTGLVCGVTPIIDSNNCCADFANAVCPCCKGKGFVVEGC